MTAKKKPTNPSRPPRDNPRHIEFVRQYFLCNRNASEAYRKTYPNSKNADVDSAKLLVNAGIQVKIKEREAQVEEKFSVSLDQIIREYTAIAFGSIDRIVEWDANDVRLISRDKLTETDVKFIDSISFERRLEKDFSQPKGKDGEYPTTPVVKFRIGTLAKEKTKALDSLVKLLGYDKAGAGKDDDQQLREALEQLDREAEGGK